VSRWLLDTNVLSEPSKPRPNRAVVSWMEAQPSESLAISAISVGELRHGIERMAAGARRLDLERWMERVLVPHLGDRIIPVDVRIAEAWGRLTARRAMVGKTVPAVDSLLAATALVHSLTLVTRNTADFSGLGLELFNPWEGRRRP
jgi:hypothetical protein